MLTLTASDKTTLSTNKEALSITTAYGVWSTRLMSAASHVPTLSSAQLFGDR